MAAHFSYVDYVCVYETMQMECEFNTSMVLRHSKVYGRFPGISSKEDRRSINRMKEIRLGEAVEVHAVQDQ